MNRNLITFLLGGLIVAVAVLGYSLYQERQSDADIEIDLPDMPGSER